MGRYEVALIKYYTRLVFMEPDFCLLNGGFLSSLQIQKGLFSIKRRSFAYEKVSISIVDVPSTISISTN